MSYPDEEQKPWGIKGRMVLFNTARVSRDGPAGCVRQGTEADQKESAKNELSVE